MFPSFVRGQRVYKLTPLTLIPAFHRFSNNNFEASNSNSQPDHFRCHSNFHQISWRPYICIGEIQSYQPCHDWEKLRSKKTANTNTAITEQWAWPMSFYRRQRRCWRRNLVRKSGMKVSFMRSNVITYFSKRAGHAAKNVECIIERRSWGGNMRSLS